MRRLRTIPGVGAADGDRDRGLQWATCSAFPRRVTSPARWGSRRASRSSGNVRAPGSHHEARRSLPADAADPRRALGAAPRQAQRQARSAARLGARARTRARPQQGRGRRGEQAGPASSGPWRRERTTTGARPADRGAMIPPSETASPEPDGAPVRTGTGRSRQQAWPSRPLFNDWLPVRGFPSWPGDESAPPKRPEIRLQSAPGGPPAARRPYAKTTHESQLDGGSPDTPCWAAGRRLRLAAPAVWLNPAAAPGSPR